MANSTARMNIAERMAKELLERGNMETLKGMFISNEQSHYQFFPFLSERMKQIADSYKSLIPMENLCSKGSTRKVEEMDMVPCTLAMGEGILCDALSL